MIGKCFTSTIPSNSFLNAKVLSKCEVATTTKSIGWDYEEIGWSQKGLEPQELGIFFEMESDGSQDPVKLNVCHWSFELEGCFNRQGNGSFASHLHLLQKSSGILVLSKVAELTGRQRRLVFNELTNETRFEERSEGANLEEPRRQNMEMRMALWKKNWQRLELT